MKLVTWTDWCVITLCCLAVALGFYGSFGCTPLSFDISGDLNYEPVEDGSVGDAGEAPPDADDDVPLVVDSDTLAEPDSGRESGDVALEAKSETAVVPDAKAEAVEDAATTVEHRTATGETYSSALPKGIYSPGLFAESIGEIQRKHTGLWNGPYDATCNLSSEGHGVAEKCQMIYTSTMGVMLCPYGISYVAASASCPPLASPVSWW